MAPRVLQLIQDLKCCSAANQMMHCHYFATKLVVIFRTRQYWCTVADREAERGEWITCPVL